MIKSSLEFLFRISVLAVLLIAIGQVSSFVQTDSTQLENGRWPEAALEPLDHSNSNPQHPHPDHPIQRTELVTVRR